MDKLVVVGLSLLSYCICLSAGVASVDDLPGWKGERRTTLHTKEKVIHPPILIKRHMQATALEFDPLKVSQISWKPRVFQYEGFLSDTECDHLMNLARDKLEKSLVADSDSGEGVASKVRTSSGMFIDRGQDEIIKKIEDRIARWTFLPPENGEAMQVLRYENGEKYEPHYDYFQDKVNVEMGGHRIATVLMYLTNVTKGGETVFPEASEANVKEDENSWSDCSKKGLAVKPKRGNALLFFSLHPDATTDPSSLHGSCAVIQGEKWSATKWIHVDDFSKRRPPNCEDEDVNCKVWANSGECEKNPTYMIGEADGTPGYCRKSCNACPSTTNASS